MASVVITCDECGAKLRLKPASLKVLKQVRCVKCRKKVPIPPELKASTAAVPLAPPAEAPVLAIDPSRVERLERQVRELEQKLAEHEAYLSHLRAGLATLS